MRRWIRIAFNSLTVISLVLAMVVTALWVRGYWVDDVFSYSRQTLSLIGESGGGQFRFEFTVPARTADAFAFSGFRHVTDQSDGPIELGERMPGSRQHFRRFGFWIVTGERWDSDHYAAFVPAWFLEAILMAVPAWRAMRRSVRKSKPVLACPICSYDLRATPDRCPECGTTT